MNFFADYRILLCGGAKPVNLYRQEYITLQSVQRLIQLCIGSWSSVIGFSLHPCFPRMERTEVLLDTDRRLKLGGEEIEKKYYEQIYAVQISAGSAPSIDRFFFFFFFFFFDF